MNCPLRLGIVACLLCDTFLFAQSPASSTIRIYRFELSTHSQESKFAKEIPPTGRVGGTQYEVETDEKGRTTRVAVIRNGKRLSERFYRFSAGAKLPDEYERFVAPLRLPRSLKKAVENATLKHRSSTVSATASAPKLH